MLMQNPTLNISLAHVFGKRSTLFSYIIDKKFNLNKVSFQVYMPIMMSKLNYIPNSRTFKYLIRHYELFSLILEVVALGQGEVPFEKT